MADESPRWARLEPRSRDRELAPGLEARVHDALWLLGRQWQFGELTADTNLGSAIAADITAQVTPLTGVRLGRAEGPDQAQRYNARGMPLEAFIEGDDVRAAPSVRTRARAGQHFERLLASHNVSKYAEVYRTEYPIAAPDDTPDAASRRFLALIAGRVIDGARLYRDLKGAQRPGAALPAKPVIATADTDAVRAAAQAWVAWADTLAFAPNNGPAAWVQERLEYAFAATTADGTTLEAAEHTDGRLDWHTFTATSTPAPTPPPGSTQQVGPLTVVPSAVTYPGMSASRLWEFEDARVDFGDVQADPSDLGRMLLTEFALIYANDWLLIPLELPTGTLARITRLDVRDTFGHTTTITPTSPFGGWGMFGISVADGASPDDTLLIAPALAASLQGRDLEEVLLLRDETANLAWAIERSVEGDNGLPADRAQTVHENTPPAPPPPAQAPDTLTYHLRTDPPEHWHPLIPQRTPPTNAPMTFRLGALPRRTPTGSLQPIRPRGRLLQPPEPHADVIIREEEIPREGTRVTRAYQLARWIDGTTFLWLGRRTTIGRGEGSSSLRYDTAEP